MSGAIGPGGTLGVFGGGQLGRMLGVAARRLGYRFAVFTDDEADGPAAQIADHAVCADYTDEGAVAAFAQQVDAVTFEFENVPAVAAEVASRHAPVRPDGDLLHTVQDRLREKRGLQRIGLPTAPFHAIESEADLADAADAIPGRGVLKTASFGYDGKGQRRVDSAADLAAAWDDLGRQPCVLEGFVPFVEEVSVVAARGTGGDVAVYEPFSNHHENHILDVTVYPAPMGRTSALEDVARTVLEGFDVVGLLCVELFRMEDGSLVVNEIAPRPHNSGHVTIEAARCCQFQNQARAVLGLPLGSTERIGPPAAMANLLGDLWAGGEPRWDRALAVPGVSLHLYGKDAPRPGRKMGHLSAFGATAEEAEARARDARAALAQPSLTPKEPR